MEENKENNQITFKQNEEKEFKKRKRLIITIIVKLVIVILLVIQLIILYNIKNEDHDYDLAPDTYNNGGVTYE